MVGSRVFARKLVLLTTHASLDEFIVDCSIVLELPMFKMACAKRCKHLGRYAFIKFADLKNLAPTIKSGPLETSWRPDDAGKVLCASCGYNGRRQRKETGRRGGRRG
mmetsp:Transcript_17021/g.45269  ORF Transcript_17021/g.45269 Transcript_17021/m.45269 type:complete len:107 (+) Transcript_17021:162-482(+)